MISDFEKKERLSGSRRFHEIFGPILFTDGWERVYCCSTAGTASIDFQRHSVASIWDSIGSANISFRR